MALSKKYRLPLRFERERVNKEGHSFPGKFLTTVIAPAGAENPRLAILVSKKVSPLAVDRNKLRRRISTIISTQISHLKTKDYLIIPKRTSLDTDQNQLEQDIQNILNDKFSS